MGERMRAEDESWRLGEGGEWKRWWVERASLGRGAEEEASVMVTGSLADAAVEGLRSWVGEGARLREAVWMVSLMRRGREEAGEDIWRVVGMCCGVAVRGIWGGGRRGGSGGEEAIEVCVQWKLF